MQGFPSGYRLVESSLDDEVKCPNCGYEWVPEGSIDAFEEEEKDPQTDFIEFEAMGESGLADIALGGPTSKARHDSGVTCPKCNYEIG